MLINHNREKLLNLIIYFVKNTTKCYKTKLFKLLFFADFLHFKETGRSITGLTYEAWKNGPVPCDLFHEIKKPKQDFLTYLGICGIDEKCKFIPKKKFDDTCFTKRELNIIKNVAFIFYDVDRDLMVESTHLANEPWHRTVIEKGQSAVIDYLLALDNKKGAIDHDSAEELRSELTSLERIFA